MKILLVLFAILVISACAIPHNDDNYWNNISKLEKKVK